MLGTGHTLHNPVFEELDEKRRCLMKRTAFRILLAISLLAAVAPAWAAQDREPVPFEPFTIPLCGFPIDIGLVSNNEFQDVTTLADGTTVTQIRGTLKLS